MSVKAQLDFALKLAQTGTSVFGATPAWSATMSHSKTLKNGTTANKYDRQFIAERVVASGATDSIDLAGILSDPQGATITAAELVGIVVINQAVDGTPNTTNLTVGGGANPVPGFSAAGPAISPGGMFALISPGDAGIATVTAGTGDILRITNSSGAQATYQIALLLRTA